MKTIVALVVPCLVGFSIGYYLNQSKRHALLDQSRQNITVREVQLAEATQEILALQSDIENIERRTDSQSFGDVPETKPTSASAAVKKSAQSKMREKYVRELYSAFFNMLYLTEEDQQAFLTLIVANQENLNTLIYEAMSKTVDNVLPAEVRETLAQKTDEVEAQTDRLVAASLTAAGFGAFEVTCDTGGASSSRFAGKLRRRW